MSHSTTSQTPIPLVIYDFRVLAYKLYHLLESTELPEGDIDRFIKCSWALLFNRGPDTQPYEPHVAIIANDNSHPVDYWRRQLFPEYKGNRKPKPDMWKSTAQLGLSYINSTGAPYHYLSVPGYEADDIAGTFVYMKRLHQSYMSDPKSKANSMIANRPIWLWTVDSDWLQLVGNGVTWHNTGPWQPRIRNAPEAIQWTKRRLKVDISCPSQIVNVKMKQGDKSDNLPPNSPRYMIDLMNSHPRYHLTGNPMIMRQITGILHDQSPNQRLDHYDKSRSWLASKGYPFIV